MRRAINLRQIEIFKAVIEHGTVSRASEILCISQPAASKHLMHLESDTGLRLFDRQKRRLAPTALGLRFYEEIDRIFANVRQVETAVETVKREDRGQLTVGVIPALGDAFIQRSTMNFLARNPSVYFSILPLASMWIAEFVRNRKIDVGLISSRIEDPYLTTESVLQHALVCIMPLGHPLAEHRIIQPEHLDSTPFIAFKGDSYIGQKVSDIFDKYNLTGNVVLTADANPTLRQFVAAGLGVSLVHPLFVAGIEDQVVVRPFEPETPINFLLCHAHDARNQDLVAEFAMEIKATADNLVGELERSSA